MIKFGSRTDILLPVDHVREVLVQVGQAVHGGETPILKMIATSNGRGNTEAEA
jgi:hypothetical protein